MIFLIYRVTCSECNCFYIGMTWRNFTTWYHEHFRSLKCNKINSALPNHRLQASHTFPKYTDAPIVHSHTFTAIVSILESLKIFKNSFSNLIFNDQRDLQKSIFWMFVNNTFSFLNFTKC